MCVAPLHQRYKDRQQVFAGVGQPVLVSGPPARLPVRNAGNDLRIMIYTAEPDTDDAERLALAVVLGTQSMVD